MSDRQSFRFDIGKWTIGFDNWDRPTTVIIRREQGGNFTAVGDMLDGGAECMRDLIAEITRLRAQIQQLEPDSILWRDHLDKKFQQKLGYSKMEHPTSGIKVVDEHGNTIENAAVRLYILDRPFELGDSEENTVVQNGVKWKVKWIG